MGISPLGGGGRDSFVGILHSSRQKEGKNLTFFQLANSCLFLKQQNSTAGNSALWQSCQVTRSGGTLTARMKIKKDSLKTKIFNHKTFILNELF